MTSLLDTVSTTRGSGWVADQRCDVANDFESFDGGEKWKETKGKTQPSIKWL